MSDQTTLYRHFNAAGELLYVGISIDAFNRYKQHAKDKSWIGDIASTTYEPCETREIAALAEKLAIKREKPIHNIAFNDNKKEKIKENRVLPKIKFIEEENQPSWSFPLSLYKPSFNETFDIKTGVSKSYFLMKNRNKFYNCLLVHRKVISERNSENSWIKDDFFSQGRNQFNYDPFVWRFFFLTNGEVYKENLYNREYVSCLPPKSNKELVSASFQDLSEEGWTWFYDNETSKGWSYKDVKFNNNYDHPTAFPDYKGPFIP